jgi:hypothetical protein
LARKRPGLTIAAIRSIERPESDRSKESTQQFRRAMFPALGRPIPLHFLARSLQDIRLPAEVFGAATHADKRA